MARLQFKRWFPDPFARKNRLAAFCSLLVMFGAATFAPEPLRMVVDGKEVVLVVVNGYIVPDWMFFGIAGIAFYVVFAFFVGIVEWFRHRKDPPDFETVKVGKIYKDHGGAVSVAWVPSEPGAVSPMEYEKPFFSADTPAAEFLAARPPSPMRALFLGEGAFEEALAFHRMQDNWLSLAPKKSLYEFIRLAEEKLEAGQWDDESDVMALLERSHQIRGIPSESELKEFEERFGVEGE